MIAFIRGHIVRVSPTSVWVDSVGVGYEVQISLKTYAQIKEKKEVFLYTYFQVREDAHVLYGFFEETELSIFKLLIQISGISGNISRMILSALSPLEFVNAIYAQDVATIRKIKGIGAKMAERILLELKGKIDAVASAMGTDERLATAENVPSQETLKRRDALQALLSLGIQKNQAEQALQKIADQVQTQDSVEHIIKLALQHL